MIMRGADKHFIDEIGFPLFHACNTTAASPLGFIDIHRHPLHIAAFRKGNNAVFYRNQILNIYFAIYHFNLCPPWVTKPVADALQIFPNNTVNTLFIGQNIQIIRNFRQNLIQFIGNFLPFHSGQLSQPHLHNRICLFIRQANLLLHLILFCVILCPIEQSRQIHIFKPFHQALLALYNGSAAPQDGNDFINVVNGNDKALQQMCSFFGFFQLVLCPVRNDFYLELQILFKNLLQGQNLWFAVDQCQQIDPYSILQLRIAEQLIQNNLWVCIFF